MMKRVAVGVVAAGLMLLAAACGKNEAATAKCKDSKEAEACNTCCKTNGASGYTFASECGCLGGS